MKKLNQGCYRKDLFPKGEKINIEQLSITVDNPKGGQTQIFPIRKEIVIYDYHYISDPRLVLYSK
ncbi:MAG: hypothetical protein GY760_21725 [Deltaproteobacteria bacterium]|nr:hypothetical protein [Deltaproteobacteria bacterium]